MHWYLVHTKPRQEYCALQNLEQQAYECYLPTLPAETVLQGKLTIKDQPLFPRYLFIRLGLHAEGQSWTPIRSTKGVSRLVRFGAEPARVPDELIELLQARQACAQEQPQRLFRAGERVRLTQGAFAGLEAIYQMSDGERRVMVLIELMSKPVAMTVAASGLRKVS